MCGPFIHGRSFYKEVYEDAYLTGSTYVNQGTRWKHWCAPRSVNSHGELPQEETFRVMQYQNFADPVYEALGIEIPSAKEQDPGMLWFPLQTENSGIIDLGSAKEVEASADGYLDWGIQPWDGKLTMQTRFTIVIRGMEQTEIRKLEDLYMPKTRDDLCDWAGRHWGMRGDAGEFAVHMCRCLDPEMLWPDLPETTTCVDRRFDADGFHEKMLTIQKPPFYIVEHDEGVHTYLAAVVSQGGFSRWYDMFRKAPSEYWADKK